MKSGSPKKPRRRTSRDRTLLTAMLVAIAVLLGLLIMLLPSNAPDGLASGVDGDGPAASDGAASEPGLAEPDDAEPREFGPSEPDDADRTGEPAPTDAPVSERYPPDSRRRDENLPEETQRDESLPDAGRPDETQPDESLPDAGRPDETQPDETQPDAEDETWWLPRTTVTPADRGPLVIVLDDAGNSLDAFDEFLAFPGPLAVAVLPQLDYSVRAAAMASAAGKDVLLHLPMEAVGGADPGPGAVGPALTGEQISGTIDENLATVPGAIGANNHMGSLATADPEVMRVVLNHLHRRALFFVDSRTSSETVARPTAAEVGIPFAERDVFLDNVRTREAILGSIRHALELSQLGDPVIMIGHVTVPLLAEILNEVHPVLEAAGYRFAGVSELVRPVLTASGR